MNATATSHIATPANVRPVCIEDLPLVGDLLDDVFRRSRGVFDQSQLTDFPLIFRPENLRNNRLIVEEGRAVSHAALWPRELVCDGRRFKVAIVASVATDPKFRHRGYATTLMGSLQQQLQSYDCAILWTTVPGFYLKLGWQLVTPRGAMTELTRTIGGRISAGPYECVPFDVHRHLDAVLELYDRNPIRLSRNRSEAEQLFSLPKVSVWVASRDGRVVAYVCHAQAVNKQGITEYGGELPGIVSLLRRIAQTWTPDTNVPMLIFHTRPDLKDWVRSLDLPLSPLPSSKGINHEMVFVPGEGAFPEDVRNRLFVWGLDHA